MPKYTCLAASLLVALCCGRTVWSNDPPKAEPPPDPCATDLTLEKLDNPPERKTKFEVLDTIWQERLVDVKAADQKFAAVIRIQLPNSRGAPFEDNTRNEYGRAANLERSATAKEYTLLQTLRGQEILNPYGHHRPGRVFGASELEYQREISVDPGMKRLLAQIPDERLPAKEQREFFTNAENNRLFLIPDPRQGAARRAVFSYRERGIVILALTPEQAEVRAKALLVILDQGFSRPLQVALFGKRVQQCDVLRQAREKLDLARKSRQNMDTKLKDYEEFTPDMLAGLRVQQLQLEVDLAGVKAKIITCEKLLAKMAELERRKPIEDAKIAAEIELSGFEARRAKSAEFVTKLKERNEITSRRDLAKSEVANQVGLVNETTRSIQLIDEEIAAFGPVRLVDDRVTIHPLEWTQ